MGGVNSWRHAADDDTAYRPTSKKQKRSDAIQTNDAVPKFKDDRARYGWEVEQWRNAAITRRKWRKWFGADEKWHVGPPVHPDSPTFRDDVAQKAFKKANNAGYMAPRMVAEAIGIGRYEAKRLMDAATGSLRVAWVLYPHRMLKGSIWNCRMLHEGDVAELQENIEHWREVFEQKIKRKEIPPPSRRMAAYLRQECQKEAE